MRTVFTFFTILAFSGLFGQAKRLKIVDGTTNAALGYVQVSFIKSKVNVYCDSAGNFEIDLSLLQGGDSIVCSHIGYKKTALAINGLSTVIRLERSARDLDSVAVKYCTPPVVARGEWPRKPRLHNSVSPGLTLIFVGVYENKTGLSGYLHRIGFHVAGYSNYLDIPVRLRWYEWEEASNQAGRELTDTSIIFIPAQRGWNYFVLPDRLVPVHQRKVVLGMEFIYPSWMIKEHISAIGKDSDSEWRRRRLYWSMGMEKPYSQDTYKKTIRQLVYHKVALRIEVKGCR